MSSFGSSSGQELVGRARLGSLLQLAWPIILARATQSVIGFCDALMVAPLGEEALAATTTGAMNSFAVIMFPMGTVFIVQSFTAQLRGRGELAAVPRYAYYGLGLSALAGLLALLAIPFVSPVLAQLDYGPRVRELMTSYLVVRLLSVGPAVAIEALGNWYGGLGNTRPAMVAGVVAMVVNVAGCYVLIEPRFGLPGYGVVGAAWASVIGSWLGFGVILIGFLLERRGAVRARLGLNLREFARMLRFGVPNGINWFLEFAAFAVFINVAVAHLGTTVLAAFNVVIQINSISFMPTFGLASAGAIIVGEAIGRRAHIEVWPGVKLTLLVACAWMGSVGLSYLLAASSLMGLFGDSGSAPPDWIDVGTGMLMLSAVWQLFDAVGLTLSETLRAAGDTAWTMAARIVLAWFVFTPLAWLFVVRLDGGVSALMGAMIGYIALLACTFAFRFASGRWRNIDLVGDVSLAA